MSINQIDESVFCPLLWEKFSPICLDEQLIEYYYSKYAAAPSSDRDCNSEVITPDNDQDCATKIEAIDVSPKVSLAPFLTTTLGQHIHQGLVDLCTIRQMFPAVSYRDKKQIGDDQDVLSKLLFSKNNHSFNQLARAP